MGVMNNLNYTPVNFCSSTLPDRAALADEFHEKWVIFRVNMLIHHLGMSTWLDDISRPFIISEIWRHRITRPGKRFQKAIENGPVEIVDLPIKNGWIF
jgi:hypothetical protein